MIVHGDNLHVLTAGLQQKVLTMSPKYPSMEPAARAESLSRALLNCTSRDVQTGLLEYTSLHCGVQRERVITGSTPMRISSSDDWALGYLTTIDRGCDQG